MPFEEGRLSAVRAVRAVRLPSALVIIETQTYERP